LSGKLLKMKRNFHMLWKVDNLLALDKSCIKDMDILVTNGKELEQKGQHMQSATDLPSAADTKEFTAARVAWEITVKDKGSYLTNRVNRLPKATIVEG